MIGFFYDELPPYNNILTISKLKEYKEGKFILKPYLRPMSSMTEEEWKEYRDINCCLTKDCNAWDEVDWLNANHFDYRDLIPMGLALEALEGMYNIKEE